MVTKKTGPVGLAKPRVVKLMPEVITLSPPREVRLTPPRVVRLSKPAEKLTPPSSGPSPRHKSRSDDRYRDAQQRGRTEQKHTPHRQDISGSESSAFSSKSLGSDLQLMINRLNKEYREQSRDTHRDCQWCRSKPHGREDCPARFKICRVCKCLGHFKVMCPTITRNGRGEDGKARNQEAMAERASDRKRERSLSVINDGPRKPQRKEYDTNVPGNFREIRKRAIKPTTVR